ncbi:MAG: glycoside hydrolase family 20 zincin-like fold domain-containing protein [Armatimonadia bacterium]
MKTLWIALSVLTCLTALAAPVPPADQKLWLRHLIPLPKQIEFKGTFQVAPQALSIETAPGVGDVGQAGAALLRKSLGLPEDQGKTLAKPQFTITFALCNPKDKRAVTEAAQLAKRPNCEQAYAIVPGKNTLAVVALDERGLYYGALTLSQLLPVKQTPQRLAIPMVSVLDWPDLNERGLWGGNAVNDIEWMSSYKMNLVEAHANLSLSPDGKGVAKFSPEKVEEGRLHAFKVVPVLTHLDQIAPLGVFERFPELQGKEPGAKLQGHAYVTAPCASQPGFVKLLSEWMTDLVTIPHVTDICIWLSENDVQCACDQCKAIGEFPAETRACVQAFRIAQKANPNAHLRILLTQGSYKTNDKVLAEIPADVNVSYYDGGRTYDSSRDPMIYPLLEDYAKKGRWLGVYPQVTASWRIVCPWSGPQFMKYRMTEFVDKKLTNLCGYATPHNRLYDFNVTAAAEWGWNAHGRDEREFAAAWATRRAVNDPEKAADWAVMLGPVGWDVYGSRVPYTAFFGEAGRMIQNRAKPVFGKGMYRYFPDEKHLADDLAICARAAKLAADLNDPWITAETQVISGYVTMLTKLNDLSALISRATPPTETERTGLQRTLREFAQAGIEVNAGLRAWEAASLGGKGGGRLQDTMSVTDQTVDQVSKALLPFGVRNPFAPYLVKTVGEYHDRDFEDKQVIVKKLDITSAVSGAGTYQVRFTHTEGYHGATVQRVAIATAPHGQTEPLTEVVFDKHYGSIGYTPKGETYTLALPAYDETSDYFLVVDMSGVKSSAQPMSRRGINGTITMWKEQTPGEAIPDLPLLPMSDAEKARYGGPKFTQGGVRVGVLQGGYGAEALLKYLQGKPGIDAQPLWLVNAANLKPCQVLIVPQPYLPETYAPAIAALLTRFVTEGGGVLTLHNSVGYRGLPVAVPEVCAKGVTHIKDPGWHLTPDTTLATGLQRGRTLTQSYYDYIVLEPGSKGTVVATGAATGRPVIVLGETGKGRYVASGLGTCIGPGADQDVPPTEDEGVFLQNAVKWLGKQ